MTAERSIYPQDGASSPPKQQQEGHEMPLFEYFQIACTLIITADAAMRLIEAIRRR